MHAISLQNYEYRPTLFRECCSDCGAVFNTGLLLRGDTGPICNTCDLEQVQKVQTRSRRRDWTTLTGISLLLVLSASPIPILSGLQVLGGLEILLFAMTSVVLGTFSAMSIAGSLRELRYDFPARDPIVLAKHMVGLAFATVTNSLNTWVFVTTLMLTFWGASPF